MRVHFAQSHACDTHAWLKLFAVRMSSLFTHLLPSRVSSVFAPAVLWRSLRDHSRLRPHWHLCPPDPAELPDLNAKVKRTLHEHEQFGYLAKPVLTTGYEPKEFDKITSVDDDMTLINDPDHNISESRKPRTRTLAKSVFTQCLNPLCCTFLIGDFVPQSESKESMLSGTRCKTKRDEREGCAISVAESMSKEGQRNGISVSLKRHRKSSSDDRDLRGHLEWRAQQAILGENSVQRKLYSTEYDMEIQKLERTNSEFALFGSQRELESQRLQLLVDIHWMDQDQREKNTFV